MDAYLLDNRASHCSSTAFDFRQAVNESSQYNRRKQRRRSQGIRQHCSKCLETYFLISMANNKSRAQVDAPIELFVAIIILVSSMALVYSVWNQVDEGKCIAALKIETQKLQSAMLDVSIASPPTSRTVNFAMPNCGGKKVRVLQFVYFPDAKYCRLCPGSYGSCWQIIPNAVDSKGTMTPITDAISCVNMAGDTVISQEATCALLSSSPTPDNCQTNYGSECSVFGYEGEDIKWQTFGAPKGSQYFTVKLTKGLVIDQGTEQGKINVCIREISDS